MFGVTYENDTLRKYSVIFGALFNDVFVIRLDSSSNEVQRLKVPIGYGPKEKFLARVNSNPDGTHIGKPAISLPRMAFQMMGMEYDSSRKLISTHRVSTPIANNASAMLATYNPVPYNIHYNLWVMVKSATDGTRIVEQILPIFKPQYTVTADILPAMQLEHDIPIVLNSCTISDDYEGNWEKRRQLIWELNFTVKGFVYGQQVSTGLIKLAQTSIFATTSVSNVASFEVISVQPGLTANGLPTTKIGETIPYSQINKNDDWAYIVQIDDSNV